LRSDIFPTYLTKTTANFRIVGLYVNIGTGERRDVKHSVNRYTVISFIDLPIVISGPPQVSLLWRSVGACVVI
jgi:hypothetical protein